MWKERSAAQRKNIGNQNCKDEIIILYDIKEMNMDHLAIGKSS